MNKKTNLLFFAACMLAGCTGQAQQQGVDVQFKKHTLRTGFISEGVATGDVNKDGNIDVMAGAYWFEAPGWEAHELDTPRIFYPDKGYSNSMLNFSMDVNQDGWIDLVRVDFPGEAAYWHENPQNKEGYWKIHMIHPRVGNESPAFVDIDGDGRRDLLFGDTEKKQIAWVRSPSEKEDTSWTYHAISDTGAAGTERFSHGLGYGDINGDGRKDVMVKEGWWEAPADPMQPGWVFHAADLGEDCSQMYAFDFDEDGDQDVVSSSAHRFGIWWHEQVKDGQGDLAWERHEITKQFSQTHALSLVDMNDDGHPDLVTGMRYFAHLGKDPGEQNAPVLYWFEFKPGGEPSWTGHEIDNDSGVGLNNVTEDITGDGLRDVVIANKKGVFVFEQERKSPEK